MNKFSMKKKSGFTLVEIMIVVLIIGILLAIAIPNFMKARETSRTNACVSNMKQIDAATQQWAMDQKKTGADTPVAADLAGGALYLRAMPTCPSGGVYTIGSVDGTTTPLSCSIHGNLP